MKKTLSLLIALVILVGIFCVVSPAIAGSVGDRAFFAGATNCVGLWTNNYDYAALELKSVRVQSSLTATNVVTFVRITSDSGNVHTNTIGVVTCASGAGVQATLTAAIIKYGDIVRATGIDAATGSASNTFTGFLEFNVNQH